MPTHSQTSRKHDHETASASESIEILTGSDLHDRVVHESILSAEKYVWIATANLKDMHVFFGRRYQPALAVFDRIAKSGVRFRIVHSDLPSHRFRSTLEGFPRLTAGALELQVCPRCHWKLAIVDGRTAYLGSANFTGAGLGAKREHRRNLEVGIVTVDPAIVGRLQTLFDEFWIGTHCRGCGRRDHCHDPIVP